MTNQDDPAPLIRLTEADYADDAGAPDPKGDPVEISTQIFDQDGDMANSANLSNMFVVWGQFLDHDLSLSPESHDEQLTADGLAQPLNRSLYEEADDGTRTPLNAITWQIDGSSIYGSTTEMAGHLRSGEGGHLRMGDLDWSGQEMLPHSIEGDGMAGHGVSKCPFLAGDVRANENPALTSMHTLFAREHNYWADRLAEENPDWTDDQLYDGARQIVEYELQQITYNEWLPHLVGDAVGEDTGYDPDAIGQISVEFSTAAFRFGHTLVSDTIPVMNEDGTEAEGGHMSLRDAFFNSEAVKEYGIDAILRGQASSNAQELDTKVIDDLNFFLLSPDGADGFSLVALNILRGQDHGLQSYVDTRAALLGDIDPDTLDPTDFSIITADPVVQAELASVYPTVHDVDLWVGGLAEDAIAGTQMGPLFTYIISDQFERTRAADETFGELDPSLGADIIAEVQQSGLSEIILRNTQIDMIQDDPFLAIERALLESDAIEGTWDNDNIDVVAKHILGAITTGRGDDRLTLTGGSKVDGGIDLGNGDDILKASSGDTGDIWGGGGRDNIQMSGGAKAGLIGTGGHVDSVRLTDTASADAIETGDGGDKVMLGALATVGRIDTGTGHDHVVLIDGAAVELVDGGEGFDQITLRDANYRIEWQDGDQKSGAGEVVYLDADGQETGQRTAFRNVEAVNCFTPGTRVITRAGTTPVEDVVVGDEVWTLDQGLQQVRWVGRTKVLAQGRHAPVRIEVGAIGNSRTMEVSPQHRMMLGDWRAELVCGNEEVLAAALHLVNNDTIRQRSGGTVEYIHILFDRHQIIMADGIPSESFHPGHRGLSAMAEQTRAEILDLFPELRRDLGAFGPAARPSARKHEVLLMNRMMR